MQSWSILFIFLAANWKVYSALLKLVRGAYYFFPILMSMSEAFLFFNFSKLSASQSFQWLRLCLWSQSEIFFEYHKLDTSHHKISLCVSVKQAGWQYIALTYSFPSFEPVCCSISGLNCCFFTCIQISQEPGGVVWYSRHFKNFPQFVLINTVKGLSIVNEAEVHFLGISLVFLE